MKILFKQKVTKFSLKYAGTSYTRKNKPMRQKGFKNWECGQALFRTLSRCKRKGTCGNKEIKMLYKKQYFIKNCNASIADQFGSSIS